MCSKLPKSGLGRLGIGQSKALLAQHSKILIFVTGGMNKLDVRAVEQGVLKHASSGVSLDARESPCVYIGGTHLLSSNARTMVNVVNPHMGGRGVLRSVICSRQLGSRYANIARVA